MARTSSNKFAHAALLLLTITTCSAQSIPEWRSPTESGAVTKTAIYTESAEASTVTSSWEVIANDATESFAGTTTIDGYTNTLTAIGISYPPAPWRTSIQDPSASSASAASLDAKTASLSSQLGPWTMVPIFMPAAPPGQNVRDNYITVIGENDGTTTWGVIRDTFIWDSARETANRSAYAAPLHSFTSNSNTFINTYTLTETDRLGKEFSTTEKTWYCSHTTIAPAKPIPTEISATMKYTDYTAWGPDKDISRSAVCTESAVTIRDGQTTKRVAEETLSWVETEKLYVTVLGDAALTIGKEAQVTGSETTAAQWGSGGSGGSPTGTGQPPSTTAQAAWAGEVTVFVNAVAFVAAAAALII